MSRVLVLAYLASLVWLSGSAFAADKPRKGLLAGYDTVVWVGLDYAKVHMIGPDFNDPDAIFPGMLQKWNDLFMVERFSRLEGALKKKVIADITGVTERNKTAGAEQILPAPGPNEAVTESHITAQDIAEAVRGYQLQAKDGIGLVFIVDRLDKIAKKGALYVVFFDVATREVLLSERQIHPAGGFGFRNFWFNVIKGANEDLKKFRK